MRQATKIQWTHHTFNAWRGCTKVSPGCAHCYADVQSTRNPRVLGVWGRTGSRPIAAEGYWQQLRKWDRDAADAAERRRVFFMSLGDFFEGADTMPADAALPIRRARLRVFSLINQTPNLAYLLLTKRPENIMPLIEQAALDSQPGETCEMLNAWLQGSPPTNVWLGTSVENQQTADERIPHLLSCPAAVRFLSCEPLLGPVDLSLWFPSLADRLRAPVLSSGPLKRRSGIDWVIVGGESGHGARAFHVDWARSIVAQCKAASVAVFVKQLGADPVENNSGDDFEYMDSGGTVPLKLYDKKGGDPAEWPEELRLREFPVPSLENK